MSAADEPRAMNSGERPSVVIVGGGLAGLATAVALADTDCRVRLLEARRSLGGRAGSFRDPATGETIDHCQHVSMGCCTNLADFCRRVGVADAFRRDHSLHFIGPDATEYRFAASPLPAPFHLAPAFWRLKYLSVGERYRIGRAMWNLMRLAPGDNPSLPTVGEWLIGQHQSPRAIELFWSVILVSALGEDLDRASLAAARKVIVDGFLSARDAYVVEVPRVPLAELYGEPLLRWLAGQGIGVSLETAVRGVSLVDGRPSVTLASGETIGCDDVVLAVPWHKLAELVDDAIAGQWPWLGEMTAVRPSPISGVHLWFDRPIMTLDHAVLPGRLSQWVFRRDDGGERGHYYQVVISASHNLAGRDRAHVIAEVHRELASIWPQAADARLLNARLVTEHAAVFSVGPGLDCLRPRQQTTVPGVLVAGDWTATGWPATMEGAVRSGYLAAEAISRRVGDPRSFLVPDLPRGFWSRLLIS